MQMGTNHFGHFLLTSLLLGVLKRTGRGARVVTVSSRAHRRATGFHIDDLNHERPGAYAAFEVYSQSKLANVLFSNELARRLEADGISCFSLHPYVAVDDDVPDSCLHAVISNHICDALL